ncbi:hypothetical protein [Pedobacter alpinus]|uniref:MetA-pathway of phenol degradation n=1 Tax=Pedobacter alpinus TaxID=1590643 RepID=A0ABW5TN22_9SPHI
MKIKYLSVLIIILSISTQTVFSQGWVKEKGDGYIKLAENIVSSNKYFAPDGSTVDITTINQFGTSIYAEYGISNKITGILNFPFYVKQTINDIQFRQSGKTIPGDQTSGVGDADLGIKYGFFQDKKIVLSTSLVFGLPFGKTGAGETGILQTGDGEFNQMLRVDASHSFYPKPVYASIYTGFNNRTKGFSDELRYGFELGFTFKKFIPIIKVNGVLPFKNGNALTSQGSLFANNIEYLSPSFELNYQITPKLGVSGSVAGAIYAKNVLKAPNYNAGFYLKW